MDVFGTGITGPLGINYTPGSAQELAMVDRAVFGAVFTIARWSMRPGLRSMLSEFDHNRIDETVYFLALDGRSGFAIRPDGELVYVFSTVKGRGDGMLWKATDVGATHLDCFDGYLPTLYARHGFVETRREENWTPGDPDVVFMARKA